MNDVAALSVLDRIADLSKRIGEAYPDARVELSRFPSGNAMLDVVRCERLYVLEYAPARGGFGVDEVREDEGFLVGYAFTSEDFEPAAERLWELVNDSSPQG
jgi:hypothetical protein